MFSLSKGSLRKILDGDQYNDPILHILQIKTIQNNQDGTTRYKIFLYDGEIQHTFGILGTQKNFLVEQNKLKVGSVIKLQEFAANVLSKDPPKVVIILLNFDIIGEMDVGQSHAALQNDSSSSTKQAVQNENIEPKKEIPAKEAKSFFNNKESASSTFQSTGKIAQPTASANSTPGVFNGLKICGIASLNPYQNKWAIKARVTNKSNIRTYTNQKGEGKLFNVEFLDNTGEIRATGFNEAVDRFYELLQVDSAYYVSKAQLKTANKQYSKIDNDYEMTFSNDTVIEQCQEAENLPRIILNLIPISEILNKNANELVDIIGVVKSVGELNTIVIKSTNKETKKRELHLVDSSNCSINCTLWGSQAEDFDGSENPVMVIKSAKVSDFNGKSISIMSSSTIQINPDIPEAHQIKGWFDQGGSEAQVQDLSNQAGSSQGGSMNTLSNWKTLDLLRDEKLGMGDKADYFTAKAVVLYAKKDNSMYMACPGENCNKKVIDQNDGEYRCEKCSKNYPNFKWRMILNINVADHTDSCWATCFQETAETILEIKTDELGELKTTNNTNFDEYFSNCAFKEFNFKLRAKMETYNDERKVKVSVYSVEPVDYVASSKRLLQKLKSFSKNQI